MEGEGTAGVELWPCLPPAVGPQSPGFENLECVCFTVGCKVQAREC